MDEVVHAKRMQLDTVYYELFIMRVDNGKYDSPGPSNSWKFKLNFIVIKLREISCQDTLIRKQIMRAVTQAYATLHNLHHEIESSSD